MGFEVPKFLFLLLFSSGSAAAVLSGERLPSLPSAPNYRFPSLNAAGRRCRCIASAAAVSLALLDLLYLSLLHRRFSLNTPLFLLSDSSLSSGRSFSLPSSCSLALHHWSNRSQDYCFVFSMAAPSWFSSFSHKSFLSCTKAKPYTICSLNLTLIFFSRNNTPLSISLNLPPPSSPNSPSSSSSISPSISLLRSLSSQRNFSAARVAPPSSSS